MDSCLCGTVIALCQNSHLLYGNGEIADSNKFIIRRTAY